MRRLHKDRPLTSAEKNRRYYEAHKAEELQRNREYCKTHKKSVNNQRRNYRHGITQEQFDEMLKTQGNRCAICRRKFTSTPHVDHSHKCCKPLRSCKKCRRGLLCEDCNLGLGRFEDSVTRLNNAIDYLERYDNAR
jgi:hypothetical protein